MTEININNLGILGYSSLEDIKRDAYNYIDNKDYDGALYFAGQLENSLKNIESSPENKTVLDVLVFWILRLKLFGFGNMKAATQIDFIKNDSVKILINDLDLQAAVYKFIDLFEVSKNIDESTKSYLQALLSSNAVLGDPAKYSQGNFSPTVSNWLKEYQKSRNSRGGEVSFSAFDIVNFINSNKLVKSLNANQNLALKRLLEFYNWLLNPIIFDAESNDSKQTYVNTQKFELPKEINIENASQQQSPPVAPVPKNAAPLKPMEDIGQPSASLAEKSGIRLAPPIIPKKQPSSLPTLQTGLRMGMPEDYKMPSKPNLPVEDTAKKIDQKLEELEKRIKN